VDDRDSGFVEFVAARQAALLRTAYLLTGDAGRAEDLVQTALTKTYLAWGRIRDPDAVEAYVRRVLATTSASWWRRRWHGERPTERLPEPAAAHTADPDAALDLWRLVPALPPRQRAVLVLRFYEDLSEAEVADALRISPGTVKSTTSRAVAALRARLADSETVEERR
jgi:RNA polymerase sigma-70 factor (sigma-E family)